MKPIIILIVLIASIFQTRDTPDEIGVSCFNTNYLWTKERNLKMTRAKSNILRETIKNGFYGETEDLIFVDKKIMSIKYYNNKIMDSVKTITNGNGFVVRNKRDTFNLINGKLNGTSVSYGFYVIKMPTVKDQKVVFAKDLEKTVWQFNNNILKNFHVYRMGILIYEEYFKNYDVVRDAEDKISNANDYKDSVRVYKEDGNLKFRRKY